MTAVEWLQKKYWKKLSTTEDLIIFQQAKEMENEQKGYSEEEVKLIEYIQWVIRKIDAGNTSEEIVRLLLFNRDKIEQFKKK
jgi:hypothetical protein